MSVLAEARVGGGVRARFSGLRHLGLMVVLLLAVGAAVTLKIWGKAAVIRTGYEIRALEQRQRELQDQRRALEIERAMLSSPERVERLARETLGMERARPGQIRIVP